MNLSLKIYRFLLKLFPAQFREEYAHQLEQQFADEFRETQGRWARVWLWLSVLEDYAVSLPSQFSQELVQDLRYASRIYSRRPFITLLVFLTLSVGIGATTGVFSVVNAVLIRSLPFRDSGQLFQLWMFPPRGLGSPSEFHSWARHSRYLEDAALFDSAEMNLSEVSGALRLTVTETSSNFFRVLGTEPQLGRSFAAEEDVPGKNAVAVISYGLWQQMFGGDARALGSTIHLNGVPLVVIGVAPAGFDYPARTAVWTPTTFQDERLPKTGIIFWQTIGRIRPGITSKQAQNMYLGEVRQQSPKRLRGPKMMEPRLIPLREQLAGPVRQASDVLMGVTLFVLLIACANVANLFLSRMTERQRELRVRTALGASKARLTQQLITEGVLLGVVAALAGLGIAKWAADLAARIQPAALSLQEYTILDWRVVGFAAIAGLVSGVLFGGMPALLLNREYRADRLAQQRLLLRGSPANRTRGILIAMQIALALILLTGSFAMARGFLDLLNTNLGYGAKHVVTMNLSLAGTREDSRRLAFYHEVLDRLRAIPGVQSAAGANFLPLVAQAFQASAFHIKSGNQIPMAVTASVTPDYFASMGTKVLFGREFNSFDRQNSDPVVIVNADFARAAGGASSVIGRKVISDWTKKEFTIVGVVEIMRYRGPADRGTAQLFSAAEQNPPGFLTIVARVRGDAQSYVPICRDAVQALDRQVPVFGAKTLDDRLAEVLARPRFYTVAILFFGTFALLLAVTAIYGVASYSIAERTHEIGVRMAVGACTRNVRTLIIEQTLLPAGIGALFGVAGAAAVGRLLEHLISTVPGVDLASIAVGGAVLAITAGLAAWIASQRILQMNPVDALRVE
jgi:putative ABC transport system permease protein